MSEVVQIIYSWYLSKAICWYRKVLKIFGWPKIVYVVVVNFDHRISENNLKKWLQIVLNDRKIDTFIFKTVKGYRTIVKKLTIFKKCLPYIQLINRKRRFKIQCCLLSVNTEHVLCCVLYGAWSAVSFVCHRCILTGSSFEATRCLHELTPKER